MFSQRNGQNCPFWAEKKSKTPVKMLKTVYGTQKVFLLIGANSNVSDIRTCLQPDARPHHAQVHSQAALVRQPPLLEARSTLGSLCARLTDRVSISQPPSVLLVRTLVPPPPFPAMGEKVGE